MYVEFNKNICNIEGIPLKNNEQEITLKYCAVSALVGDYNDENPTPGERCQRLVIARKIHKGDWDLTTYDVEMVKKCIGKCFGTLVVGAAFEMLDIEALGRAQPTDEIANPILAEPEVGAEPGKRKKK